ncbi:MAG: O-acetylhomoserine aminocarboxypropyltransferase [Pseudomonadota bacterium]
MADSDGKTYGIETKAVHAGARPDPVTGARATPIYQTTSFVFDDVDHAASLFNLQTFGYIYSRITNPTVAVFEERIASLEDGRAAVACGSGHAAQFLCFFTLLEPGDHIVASKYLYGGSVTQFTRTFPKIGWTSTLVDPNDLGAVEAAIQVNTKALFVEALANPGGIIVDLEPLVALARKHKIPLVVDNTMATPYLCQPIHWGADIVVHSATKFIGGHGNSMGGVIVEAGTFDWFASGKFPGMTEPEPAYHGLTFAETFGDFGFTMKARAVALRDFGPALSPTNAFNLITGCETLPLRMQRQCDNALAVATFLETHPKVAWVSYAGLPANPYHELANRYLKDGYGSVFTFGVKGGFDAGTRVVETVNLFSHLANIGDTRSLIIHPASTTHRQLEPAEREAAGAGDDVIRLSIGIETVTDLIDDLDQALNAA